MMSKIKELFCKEILECLSSLDDALDEAGGRIQLDKLSKISAVELISILAPNKIRFIYERVNNEE